MAASTKSVAGFFAGPCGSRTIARLRPSAFFPTLDQLIDNMLLYAKRETDLPLVEKLAAINNQADQRDYLSRILKGQTFAQADHWLATPSWKRDVMEQTPMNQAIWDCFQMITMPVDHWWRDLETLGKPLSRDQQGLFYKHLAGQIAHACRQETGTTPEILFRVLHKYGQALHDGSPLGDQILRAPWTVNGHGESRRT